MALFIKQSEQRTQLQEKIAADLANRLNSQSINPTPDVGPSITSGTHQASSGLMWLWLLMFLLAVLVIGWLLFGMPQR
ncbi:MAG TPA: hypothetical protein VNX65_01625 [Patescibacteria group bacterium]|nr:hypothetical protein [Patescibacteria group bacterium]